MTRDIKERLIVSAWGCVATCLIIWMAIPNSNNETVDDTVSANTCVVEDADDFEGEFPVPAVAQVKVKTDKPTPQQHLVAYNGRFFSYSKKFADRNAVHLTAAEAIGLAHGPENRAAAAKMKDELREVTTNKYYVVDELTHSLPYLVPTAANRLDSIGKEFNTILTENNLPHYRFRVTSVLRSQEDIRRLKRCNSNCVSNSPHNYGTTFDIGYCHFDKVTQTVDSMADDNLKLVLAQALLNQQRAGHIYVKYEYKQGCFHITARN